MQFFHIVVKGVQRPLDNPGIQVNGHPILKGSAINIRKETIKRIKENTYCVLSSGTRLEALDSFHVPDRGTASLTSSTKDIFSVGGHVKEMMFKEGVKELSVR
jgi:hypothetical protein